MDVMKLDALFDMLNEDMYKNVEQEKAMIFMDAMEVKNEDIVETAPESQPVEQEDPFLGEAAPVVEEDAPVVALAVPENKFYYSGGMRHQLVFEGVCVACAHCGQPLTDSESVERGLGPICSKKGYLEEVEPKDDAEAMMALAEFPELVDYLVKKYKPKGNRGLVNGLTRTASLNRRTPVHGACTDAIEALGYKRLASALRESISAVEIFEIADQPKHYGLWIKKADFSWLFWNELKRNPGVYMTKYPKKATLVPKEHRKILAQLLVNHYEGLYVKTPKGSHKITNEWFGKMSGG